MSTKTGCAIHRGLLAGLYTVLAVLPAGADAQCTQGWAEGFGTSGNGMDDTPLSWAIFDDDGAGPNDSALFVGGWFNSAGGATVNKIAKWTGSGWSPLGAGISGANVTALAVFDDDGEGPNPPALYVAGDFFVAGGISALHIARWNGVTWSAVGNGLTGGRVYTLTVFDDGGGKKLYAGGDFAFSGGTAVPKIARWDGANWSAVPNSFNSEIDVLYEFEGDLYAGGMFTSPNNIARWNGTSWSPLGIGLDGHPMAMAGFDDDGDGPLPPALYVAGYFRRAGGIEVNYIARWNGTSWSSVNGGVGGTTPPEAPFVRALAVYDDGDGPALYLAGEFYQAGGIPANSVARWDGTTYSALGKGIAGSLPWVFSMAVFDEGAGPALWLGGVFETAGGQPSRCVARWSPAAGDPCDTNCDGSVNGFDIQPFIDALSPSPPTPCSACVGDVNGDGSLNGFDIQPFVACLGG